MEEREFRKKYEGRENVKSMDEFTKLFNEAISDANDYGSIVVCCALMMNAAFSLVNNGPSGGLTGFQAGCLMWEMVTKYGMYEKDAPLRLINFNDLLYPQYASKFTSIPKETWERVIETAKNRLKDSEHFHPNVKVHMERVANGEVPFGLTVSKE